MRAPHFLCPLASERRIRGGEEPDTRGIDMKRLALAAVALALAATPAHAETRTFTVTTTDGAPINGQADLPSASARTAIIFVAGTGMFDRDASFGRSGTPRDLIFADLAQRMNARGLATVR